jgi:acylaminoacyl-peptidase
VPHGGPHACTSTVFFPAYLYLATVLNAGILHVNFRGSTGFGQASIVSLPGNIGTNDVQDILQTLDYALNDTSSSHQIQFNPQKLAVVGGSHGGFLTAHLAARYPNRFQVVAMRNPVIDIPAELGVADIPDWCYVESLGIQADQGTEIDKYYSGTINPHQLQQMHTRSPIAVVQARYANRCQHPELVYRTPTLLCIGLKDRRVPPSQGFAFYHLLKGLQVPSKMVVFPDDVHAIDTPVGETEQWLNIALWFKEYLLL